MLLKEYLTSLGLSNFGGRADGDSSLRRVGQFEIGQDYSVVLLSGARIEFPDLHTLTTCLYDELRLASTYDVEFGLLGVGRNHQFVVIPKNSMGRPWGRNMKKLAEDITIWVTEFNIMGQWSSDIPRLKQDNHWSVM